MRQSVLALTFALVAQSAREKRPRTRVLDEIKVAGVRVINFDPRAKNWIFAFEEDVRGADIEDFCEGKCQFRGHPQRGGIAFAKMRGTFAEVEDLLEEKGEIVDHVSPDLVEEQLGWDEPDVSFGAASSAWGLDRIGAHGRITTGAGVHIYIQDTGVRATHEDFGGRVVPTVDLSMDRLIECARGTMLACTADVRGHGTHCAGSAAGTNYGVAPGATIHAVKTLSDYGNGQRSWQYAAIDWITTKGLRPAVLSMSLGGLGKDELYGVSIDAASEAGVVVVVAAGNANTDACFYSPAYTPSSITVGATTSLDARAEYSNFGTCVDIFAPGSYIVSASQLDDKESSVKSGTSMACPHVSGAVALLLETSPDMDKDDVLQKLLENAEVGAITGLKTGDPDSFLIVDGTR